MTRKLFITYLKAVAVAFLLFVLLFADGVGGLSSGFIDALLKEITAIFHDPGTQWMVFLCLVIYLIGLLLLRSRMVHGFWRTPTKNLLLAFVLLISAVSYSIDYEPSMHALTLLGSAVLGQGAAVWAGLEIKNLEFRIKNGLVFLVVSMLVLLLTLASVWTADLGRSFEYHGHVRPTGPWDNPNVYGLLMGTGVALVAGLLIVKGFPRHPMSVFMFKAQSRKPETGSWKLVVGKFTGVILCLVAAGLMGRGLLYSYSRGAWCGTLCGLAYLAWRAVQSPKSKVQGYLNAECGTRSAEFGREDGRSPPSPRPAPPGEGETFLPLWWIRRNGLCAAIVACAVAVLLFWHFRETEWQPARRALSATRSEDFSWRNRVAAWEGALQIMAEHPWFGAGWNKPEPLYEHYYLSPKLSESAAIQMNDYLMLGVTLGVPALFCFGMYVWLSLARSAECGMRNLKARTEEWGKAVEDSRSPRRCAQELESDWLKVVCRAVAIVLLVGFWFDGGLFKLATAAPFWILLELSSP